MSKVMSYRIGDIIEFYGIVNGLGDDGVPFVDTDGSNIKLLGHVCVGDYIKRDGIVLKATQSHFARGGFRFWLPATKEESDAYVKKQEEAKVKDVSTETLMAEIVRRHREKPADTETSK